MTNQEKLADSFRLTQRLIQMQAAGLTHAESVLQLPFRGNCFNWVLGHIVEHRDQVLAALGEPGVLTAAETAVYKTGSDPVVDGETAVSLERLLAALDTTRERIEAALSGVAADAWDEVINERGQTRGERVAGLHWHETYHTGQLEILRQLAGKDDKIV